MVTFTPESRLLDDTNMPGCSALDRAIQDFQNVFTQTALFKSRIYSQFLMRSGSTRPSSAQHYADREKEAAT